MTVASIRGRLLVWLSTLLTLLLVGSSLVDYRSSVAPMLQAYDQSLSDAALGLVGYLSFDSGGLKFELPAQAARLLQTDSRDTISFRVIDPAGKTLAGDDALSAPSDGPVQRFYDLQLGRESLRVFAQPISTSFGVCQILVAETKRKREDAQREILWSRVATDSLILLLTLGLVWFAVGAAMQPLDRLARQVEVRSGDDLRPLPVGEVPREARPLVLSLNRLFGLIGETQDGQRRFIENAAHQLRTPLTGLKGQIELAVTEARTVSTGVTPLTERLGRVKVATDRLTHLANQLLTLARSDRPSHDAASRQQVRLPELVDDVVASCLDAALAKRQDLGAEAEPATLRAVSWELRELLSNLIDNAIRHTPELGRITVRCGIDRGATYLEVEDDGPGIPAPERQRVFERFYRLPSSPPGGSGLGLAIVKEVVGLYDGRVEILEPRQGPGTRVRVTFAGYVDRDFADGGYLTK